MSIWSSIGRGDPDVMAIENDGDAVNYRGEGTPDVHVDLATARSWHELIRLQVWRDDEPRLDVEVLLPPDAARLLRDQLTEALGEKP
jgi:hypothetical protein